MNQVLQSWKKSLELFIPKNFKLFVLVTVANIIRTYKHLFTYFVPLLIIAVIAQQPLLLKSLLFLGFSEIVAYLISFMLVIVMMSGWFFASYICARPSMLQKNFFYFKQYCRHFIYFLIFQLLFLFIQSYFFLPFASSLGLLASCFVWFLYIFFWITVLFFPLFLLDAQSSLANIIASIGRSALMALYNLPVCLLLFLIGTFVRRMLVIIFSFSPFLVHSLLVLLLPAAICVITTIYVKKLHEQFLLYFKK